MSLPLYTPSDQRWNILQEGAVRIGSSSPYLLLLSALDQGWTIHQPVQIVPNPIHPQQSYYHISLARKPGRQKRQLALPHSPELEEFLAAERFEVKMKR